MEKLDLKDVRFLPIRLGETSVDVTCTHNRQIPNQPAKHPNLSLEEFPCPLTQLVVIRTNIITIVQ